MARGRSAEHLAKAVQFGANMAKLRMVTGLGLREVAKLADSSASVITALEHGTIGPYTAPAHRIAAYFGTTVDAMAGGPIRAIHIFYPSEAEPKVQVFYDESSV